RSIRLASNRLTRPGERRAPPRLPAGSRPTSYCRSVSATAPFTAVDRLLTDPLTPVDRLVYPCSLGWTEVPDVSDQQVAAARLGTMTSRDDASRASGL
ncbi:MAG: hypothetical protein AVDCRST_MAG49-3667, partial [uncultured Thermomicrobiales bacterium]